MFMVMGRDIGSAEVREVYRSERWMDAMDRMERMVEKYADALGTEVQWDRHDHAHVVACTEGFGAVGVELHMEAEGEWFTG